MQGPGFEPRPPQKKNPGTRHDKRENTIGNTTEYPPPPPQHTDKHAAKQYKQKRKAATGIKKV